MTDEFLHFSSDVSMGILLEQLFLWRRIWPPVRILPLGSQESMLFQKNEESDMEQPLHDMLWYEQKNYEFRNSGSIHTRHDISMKHSDGTMYRVKNTEMNEV